MTAAAGPATSPFPVTGNTYLAGPYKGAPLSLVFITPAVAGPFDLGNVVVGPPPASIRETRPGHGRHRPAAADPRRHPAAASADQVEIDRYNFTLNPTNCSRCRSVATRPRRAAAPRSPDPSRSATATGLGFNPKLALSLKGGTKRRDHPALSAVLTPAPGDANIARAIGRLPHSEFLESRTSARSAPGSSSPPTVPGRLDLRLRDGRRPRCSTGPSRRAGLPAQLLQQAARPGCRPGGQIDVAWPGGSTRSRRRHPQLPSKASPTPRSPNSSCEMQGGQRACWKTARTSAPRPTRRRPVQRPERPHVEAETGAHRRLR